VVGPFAVICAADQWRREDVGVLPVLGIRIVAHKAANAAAAA
jgi:hypothetical protein